jgi:tetraacyldisaccharide 4'-kinase
LREPLASLARAHAIVITLDTPADHLPPGIPVWRVARNLTFGGGRSPSSNKAIAFCGIARPNNFFRQLRANGTIPVAEVAFRDHHRYTDGDVVRLQKLATEKQADSFITTAKDAINLEEVWKKELQSEYSCPPLLIAKLEVKIENSAAVLDQLLSKLALTT